MRRKEVFLNNKERRAAVKKFLMVTLLAVLSIPTATVDSIVKTMMKMFTFQFGF